MSQATSTAFQYSPIVQTRSFATIATLATSDVDDDFVYQITVALNVAFAKAQDGQMMIIVGILRCICKLIPSLVRQSRYLSAFFWLGVSLLQSGLSAFCAEAYDLIKVTLEVMEKYGHFRRYGAPGFLLDARAPLLEFAEQFDEFVGLSFHTDFSLSLAQIIFKGIRHTALKDAAEGALRMLTQVMARSYHRATSKTAPSDGTGGILCPDVLGYFLALLPFSTNAAAYRRLLKDCMIEETWFDAAGLPDEQDEAATPRPNAAFLGISDSQTALMVATMICTMLGSAQGDDAETEMLYGLLSELSLSFPDVMNQVYVSL